MEICSCVNRQNGRHDQTCEAGKGATAVASRECQRPVGHCSCSQRVEGIHHPDCELSEQGTGKALDPRGFLGPDDLDLTNREPWNPGPRDHGFHHPDE